MDKDRQIEEIKRDIAPLLNAYVANTTGECWNGSEEDIGKVANRLIEKGYRKQSEGEWREDIVAFCNVCSLCKAKVDRYAIKCNSGKLNFCPNCGAKMTKGDVD